MVRIRAEELYANRTLQRIETNHFPGALVAVQDPLGRDELGHCHIGSLFLTDAAKHRVCDSCHRSQIKRAPRILKPREHRETLKISASRRSSKRDLPGAD